MGKINKEDLSTETLIKNFPTPTLYGREFIFRVIIEHEKARAEWLEKEIKKAKGLCENTGNIYYGIEAETMKVVKQKFGWDKI